MILQWLASPEWAQVVKALLHTLWQAALVAAVLGLVLRHLANPATRYRCSLAALIGVLAAGLISWAVLNRASNAGAPLPVRTPNSLSMPTEVGHLGEPSVVVIANASRTPPKLAPPRWTAWLALVWLAGAGLMLARTGAQVAGAERLRRACRPLEDPRVAELVAGARRAIGLARQLRVVVTDKLTSPAVVGVLVPTLILPLSLVTALTPEQIRFVLLHELAHIRRGDYLANLFQLFTEAILFFNPAVWWISRQVRREREACCDALAIEFSGAPADYARTLVHVAESILNPPPAAAPAFGDKTDRPSSLAERIQRLLVPGYRPALRLTWRAMLTSLMMGGVLLVVSAVGTRVTIAAAARLLTPQERVERIEKKMTEFGQKPKVENFDSAVEPAPKVEFSGRIRTADGTPLPSRVNMHINSRSGRSSIGSTFTANDGAFSGKVQQGEIFIGGELTDYAPVAIGPFDGTATNRLDNLELVFERGFDIQVAAMDAETGKPVTDARFRWQFWLPNGSSTVFTSGDRGESADAKGAATLSHCARLPLDVTVDAPGYELTTRRFDTIRPGHVLRISAPRGIPTTGVVLDKTGAPISGAAIRVCRKTREGTTYSYGWDGESARLATTDEHGGFALLQLQRGWRYQLAVTAPGRESAVLEEVQAGQSNLMVRLGPELVVRGRILGDLASLPESDGRKVIEAGTLISNGKNFSPGFWRERIRLTPRDGAAYFEFTNRFAGGARVQIGERVFDRQVDSPVDDWVIDLRSADKPPETPKREVVFRFKDSTGIPLRGVVRVSIPDDLDPEHGVAHSQEMEIQDGEVRATIAIGGRTSVDTKQTIGFRLKDQFAGYVVTNGPGPMVIDIPVVPAGAIYVRSGSQDGGLAPEMFFSVIQLEASPLLEPATMLGAGSGSPMRKWVSDPMPLGGTYQVVGSRGNSFCISKPITLTEEKPDAEVELRFTASRSIEGRLLDPEGKPLRNVDVKGNFSLASHGFGLRSVTTDENGAFRFDNATSGVGKYSLEVASPGCRAENVEVDFSRLPLTIRLKPGLTLAGQVIEVGTGYVCPNTEIRALAYEPFSKYPLQTTRTDADGRFEFTTLGDATYRLFVDGAYFADPREPAEYKAGQATPLRLEVKLYPGSRLVPKPPSPSRSQGDEAPSQNAEGRMKNEEIERSLLKPAVTAQAADAQTLSGQPDRSLPGINSNGLGVKTSVIQTSRGRQEIMAKLNQIRLDSAFYDSLPLGEVLRHLSAEVKKRDPDKRGINFLINPSPRVSYETIDSVRITINPPLRDIDLDSLLYAIVVAADRPIKYTTQDSGIVFTARDANETPMQIRKFKVRSKAFVQSLEQFISANPDTERLPAVSPVAFSQDESEMGDALVTSTRGNADPLQSAFLCYFASLGADMSPETGRNFFYSVTRGELLVRATHQELDIIENSLETLKAPPPQINIKGTFVEVSSQGFEQLLRSLSLTNASGNSSTQQFTAILTAVQFRAALSSLQQRKDIKMLCEGQMTTLNGRQCQIQAVDLRSIVFVNTNGVLQTNQVPLGPALDAIPYVLAEDRTVALTAMPTMTEFLGYDDPGAFGIEGQDGTTTTYRPGPMPRFHVRQMSVRTNVPDGRTLVLGGSGATEVTPYESKVLLPGELPLLGQQFRGGRAVTKTNCLVVFVTPTIVDAGGNRVHADE
jgi:beta-lactamase regulating signal transducer with metallopeptidase domain